MEYTNTELKLDQLVSYFNEEKINLSPSFQRGRVWPLSMRKELIKNIVLKRPIPAIFLYLDADGAKYSYNILDGKQRLESILMFIGNLNKNLAVMTCKRYIFGDERKNIGFPIDLKDGSSKRTFENFTPEEIRDLREYRIPTIQIALDASTQFDEIVSLFVDINQKGQKVSRLNIVRAMKAEDPFLKSVYSLVAFKQPRGQDVFTKKKRTPFKNVLSKLQIIAGIQDADAQADRMWEKLFELALFVRSGGTHRKPTEILKTFINNPKDNQTELDASERKILRNTFSFLDEAYRSSELGNTRLAIDQTHFYTMVTTLLLTDIRQRFTKPDLIGRLVRFGKVIDGGLQIPKSAKDLTEHIKEYRENSAQKTTDTSRREERQKRFIAAVELITESTFSPPPELQTEMFKAEGAGREG